MAKIGSPVLLSALAIAIFIIVLVLYRQTAFFMEIKDQMTGTGNPKNMRNELNSVETVNWTDIFSFVPNGIEKCQQLFLGEKHLPTDFQRQYDNFVKSNAEYVVTEGQSASTLEVYLMYLRIVKAPFIKTVCETGFNGGCSSFAWLQGNPNTHVYSFDIGEHDYGKPRAEYLMKKVPGRLTITWGNSLETLPKFRKENPDVKCDLIIVDGGHTYPIAKSDFDEFRQMANYNNMVILDNYPDRSSGGVWFKELGDVWEQAKRDLLLSEFFHCNFWPERMLGLSVGRYIFV